MWKNALVLAIVCTVAALSLAVVNQLTAERIEERLKAEREEALQAVFAEAERFEGIDISPELAERLEEMDDIVVIDIYAAYLAEERLGFVFQTGSTGYGGEIILMIGFSTERDQVVGMRVLEHSETPGLGANIEEPGFLEQFVGRSTADPVEVTRDIEALTGATISSRAVALACRGVIRIIEEVTGL